MTRERFDWDVALQAEDGQTTTVRVSAFWSPDYDGVTELVADAAAWGEWWKSKKQLKFFPLQVERAAA